MEKKAFSKREYLISILKKLRIEVCAYSWKNEQAKICDCKYGFKNREMGGEQTGCPELYDLIRFLEKLTEDEFDIVTHR